MSTQLAHPKDRIASEINSPDLDPKTLEAGQRAIVTASQAWELAKGLREENRDRNTKNGRIMAKYNSEQPHSQAKLESGGQGWQANFSTKPLATLIDKVAPRFTKTVHSAKYLTGSAAPEDAIKSTEKTEAFRREVTKTIRGWKGWKQFLADLAQENALFGYAFAAWTDEYSWRPTFYRQDQAWVPQGTKQTADSFQLFVAEDPLMIHEVFELVRERDAAQTAGWDIENTVKAINEAAPASLGTSSDSNDYRKYEDLIRDTSIFHSYSKGAKVVQLLHVFVVEHTGLVSHFILNGRNGDQLFFREDRFDNMSEVVAPFSFQQASGTLHGSKGIGREVYNIAGVLDRARNEVVNRLHLSGKQLYLADEKQVNRFRMSVVGGAVIVPDNYQPQQMRLDGNVEPFLALDNYLERLLDQIAGGVTPKEFQGERVTKAAIELYASREEEKRDIIIERFLLQVGDMVTTMQKRLCDPRTTDDEAKKLQARLLQIMTPEELDYLRLQPALESVDDFTQNEAQMVVAFADSERGNPLFDQQKLTFRKTAAMFGDDFARDVIIDAEDQTVVAEATRVQMLENLALSTARPVPVSPRDNHRVHIDTATAELGALAQALGTNPEQVLPAVEAFLTHISEHINAAVQSGVPEKEFAEDIAGLKQLAAQVGQIKAEVEASAQPGGEQLPPEAEQPPLAA
jgi:hypothetical protein